MHYTIIMPIIRRSLQFDPDKPNP
ncbi:hypothetical protein H9Q72_014573, partial [Fusarium xylarioides]